MFYVDRKSSQVPHELLCLEVLSSLQHYHSMRESLFLDTDLGYVKNDMPPRVD